ncbi:MAG: aspartyl protease family protein [Planctomycetota bacterium]
MPRPLRMLLLLSILALVAAPSPADDTWPPEVQTSLEALEQALRDHDFGAIEGLLAPDFRYAGHEGALARTIMEQVVAGYPEGLAGVTVLDAREEPDGSWTLRAVFDTAGGPEEHAVRLSADGRLIQAEVARIRLAGHGEPADGEESWSVSLGAPAVQVPFELRDAFPVPLVEVHIGDRGPYLFAVDTAAACTVLLRRSLADELGLEEVGAVAVADGSGRPSRPAANVRLPELRLGEMVARDLVAIAHSPSAAHAASIPDDAVGILGRVLFESLLLTLDYPGRRLTLREGRLEPGPAVASFDFVRDVMQLNVDLGGRPVAVFLDSGHRGTVTLPRSWADRLPLAGPLVDAGQTATVNVTYDRQAAPLAGAVVVAGERVESPTLYFADEHTPKLMGGGLLREFVVTIDQRSRLVRFERGGAEIRADAGSL